MSLTRIVPIDDPGALDAAAAALLRGEPIVVPTETVYGLAALPGIPGATAALFALKDRPDDVPLAVLVASTEQATALSAGWPAAAARLAARWWPGPLTVVVTRRAGLDIDLGAATTTVGLRCPDHDFVRALAARTGPIAATSANRHGQPTPVTAAGAVAGLAGPVALVVDGGRCGGLPSTVVDCTGPRARVVREGALPAEAVLRIAAGNTVR
jgi:tRNA threonylcarbamoyl adenosine modification protein (Sua5/YciO/YrdC/YwlC family)